MRAALWLPLALGARHYAPASQFAATRQGGDGGLSSAYAEGGRAWRWSGPSHPNSRPRVSIGEKGPTGDAGSLASYCGGIAMVLLLLRSLRSAMASVEGVDGEFSPSHKHVELSGGLPTEFKFHYVDEQQCIGCTWCADVARNTFFMESERGRGRVFRQHGDSVDVIQEAIACCPVNAIHGLSWEQLVSSETLREENARLV